MSLCWDCVACGQSWATSVCLCRICMARPQTCGVVAGCRGKYLCTGKCFYRRGVVGGAGISLGESRTVWCGNTLKIMLPFFPAGGCWPAPGAQLQRLKRQRDFFAVVPKLSLLHFTWNLCLSRALFSEPVKPHYCQVISQSTAGENPTMVCAGNPSHGRNP